MKIAKMLNLTVLLLFLSMASTASAMQIFVNRYGTIYTLDVEASDTVDNVKAKIQAQTLDNPAAQILSYNGTVLENGRYLSDYNIQKESTLTLVIQALIVTDIRDYTTTPIVGTLRKIVTDATAGDTIAFDANLNGQTIRLLSELTVNKHLKFVGNGVSNTIISGDSDNNGVGDVRLFTVGANITASWTDLTLTKGRAGDGGCINSTNGSVLTLTRVTASACTATNNGGALWGYTINIADSTINNNTAGGLGGGIRGTETLTITNSTLSNNTAAIFGGGVSVSFGALTLTNSTLTGNSANNKGGGISIESDAQATIRHSTITGNTGTVQAGGIYFNGNQLTLGHTILAGNAGGSYPDAYFGPGMNTSAGYNRIGTIGGTFTAGTGDQTGVTASSLSLGALADNGGPTQTMAIGVDSVALNAGDPAFAGSPTTDQRGTARVQMGRIDIGAYERANTTPTFVGSTTTLTVAQSASATDIKSLLHASDADLGQTLTWTQSSAPTHGTLSFSSATASSGSTDITPGGTITYTPTAGYVGSDSFTVQVSDGTASATRSINVTISAPTVTVDALTLNSMVVGMPFVSQTFTASGGYGSYSYSVSAGTLPAGLNLSTAGLLSGTPTTAGAYSFTVQATDSSTGTGAPFSGTHAFSGTVAPAPINGACGSSHGGTFTTAPATNLCADSSTPSVSESNTNYTWNCAGSNSGNPASCSATRNYVATASAGTGGSINPSSRQVAYNATTTFTVTPTAGYTASVGGSCGGSLVGTTYTTNAVTTNCSVSATFSLNSYSVTPSAGANGSISPTGAQTVNHGATTTFTVTPNTGYTASVGGSCGGSLVGTTYTTNAVTANCSVSASFTASPVTIFTGASPTGTGNITATLSGGGAGCGFVNPRFIAVSASAGGSSAPPGVSFPHGLFDFSATSCTSSIAVEITYPQSLPAGTKYWKYGPTSTNTAYHWYEMNATIEGATARFTIVDGGLGDDDLNANGTIVDAGGAGSAAASPTAIPTLSEWAMILLASLMALIGLSQIHRRQEV